VDSLIDGDKLDQADFKGVFIAGNAAPLIWDFNNLLNHPELEIKRSGWKWYFRNFADHECQNE
jgi:hypothetical protein